MKYQLNVSKYEVVMVKVIYIFDLEKGQGESKNLYVGAECEYQLNMLKR